MKARITALFVLFLCLTGPLAALAAVAPVIVLIDQSFGGSSFTNYTVPAGKVLLIEHLSAYWANNNPSVPRMVVQTQILNMQNNGITTMDWGFATTDQYQEVTLVRPLRIPGGGVLTINPSLGYNHVDMMGLMIDTTDLYAANVAGSVELASLANGELSGTVSLVSPRPVRIASSISSDLRLPWSPNTTQQKQRGADPHNWTVQTAATGNRQFLSIGAKAPEGAPPTFP